MVNVQFTTIRIMIYNEPIDREDAVAKASASMVFAGILFAACLAPVLSSCGAAARASRVETQAIGARIRADFAAVRAAEDALVASIESVYADSSLELSVDGMDVAAGGEFAVFEGGKYYYKTARTGCCYYCSPRGPVTDAMRREIRTMGYCEGALQKAWNSLPPYLSIVFYGIHEPTTIGMLYPWDDVVSVLPPGLCLMAFDWYRRGYTSKGSGLWSAQPFADLTNGWTMDLSKSVRAFGATKGAAVIGVRIMKAGELYLGKAATPILLLASDSTLMGASPSARAAFGLAPLEDAALVKQMSANIFVPANQRLNHESRPDGIRSLAARVLAGESGFSQGIAGAEWRVESVRISEIGFYLVGLGKIKNSGDMRSSLAPL